MLSPRIFIHGLLAVILAAGSTMAQEHEHATGDEKLGTVHFATSCNPAA